MHYIPLDVITFFSSLEIRNNREQSRKKEREYYLIEKKDIWLDVWYDVAVCSKELSIANYEQM